MGVRLGLRILALLVSVVVAANFPGYQVDNNGINTKAGKMPGQTRKIGSNVYELFTIYQEPILHLCRDVLEESVTGAAPMIP